MYDISIINGRIADPMDGIRESNVAVKGGRIAEITDRVPMAKRVIDAAGQIVSPGFVDIHMHEDPVVSGSVQLRIFNSMALMGVTTAVGGNCGIGHWKVGEYLDAANRGGLPVNYAGLIGMSGIREEVGCGNKYSSASKEQIAQMRLLTERELRAGALGVSFGLEYIPGTSTEEMLEICTLVSGFSGRLVSCHYRYDAIRSLEALAEMIILARETGVRFQISHLSSCTAFGQMREGLDMIAAANGDCVDILADAYPYHAFCSFLGSAVFDEGCFDRWKTGYESILISSGTFAGQRCSRELFEQARKEEPGALAVAFVMNESEIIEALRHPLVMVASDGLMSGGGGHPRAAGTFPRILGRYVREKRKLELTEAIRKMTLMPAQRIGLAAKGRIAEGFDADITIFNPESVIDCADFEQIDRPPGGISWVMTNGELTVDGGRLTGMLPGRAIQF